MAKIWYSQELSYMMMSRLGLSTVPFDSFTLILINLFQMSFWSLLGILFTRDGNFFIITWVVELKRNMKSRLYIHYYLLNIIERANIDRLQQAKMISIRCTALSWKRRLLSPKIENVSCCMTWQHWSSISGKPMTLCLLYN